MHLISILTYTIFNIFFLIINYLLIMQYICSCLPIQSGKIYLRKGVDKVIGFLNGKKLNQQILQQEKCSEEYEQGDFSAHYHPIQISNDKKIDNKLQVDQTPQISKQLQLHLQESIEDESLTKNQRYLKIGKYHLGVFKKHLMMPVQEEGFERLYSSQDNSNLKIYYKQQLNVQSKRINVFQYTYHLNMPLNQYLEIYNEEVLTKIENNIKSYQVVQQISENLKICYAQYKKVLIVLPRDFVYLHYKQLNPETKEYYAIGTSVQNQKKNLDEEIVRGTIFLAGTFVNQKQNGVQVHTYLQIDLNLNINPLMIKQPIIREIKKYVQSIIQYKQVSSEDGGI